MKQKKLIPGISALKNHFLQGDVIAYPTEAVYGLGCDPFNQAAVLRILALKQRDISRGLIIIGSKWEQIESLVTPLSSAKMTAILASWPGPITWVLPATKMAPKWITGDHNTIAVRITNHPTAYALCEALDSPIVSTSANPEGEPPARTVNEVKSYFSDQIKLIIPGNVGPLSSPTPIRDGETGAYLRK